MVVKWANHLRKTYRLLIYTLLMVEHFYYYSFTGWRKSTLNTRSRIFQYIGKSLLVTINGEN